MDATRGFVLLSALLLLGPGCGNRAPSAEDGTGDAGLASEGPIGGDDDGTATQAGDDDGPGADGSGDGPALPGSCTTATTRCTEDGYGTETCGWDPDLAATDWGWRVPCGDGETCNDGVCQVSSCRAPELLFVVDRSDSQLDGDKWSWVSSALAGFGNDVAYAASQGVRMFPDYPCQPGNVEPIVTRPEGVADLLEAPTTGASTPIRAALADLAGAFGDPDQAQAVILVTDGDETCEPDASPELEASNLFRLGIRVYAIGVSTQANLALLDEIAAAGGTGKARLAADGEALRTALDEIMADMHACTKCSPGAVSCIDGGLLTCDASGSGFASGEACHADACLDAATCFPTTCVELCAAVAGSDAALSCFISEFAGETGYVCEDCESCLEFADDLTCSYVAMDCF